METKPWYQSKGIWAAVGLGAIAAVEASSQALGHPIIIPAYIKELLMGLGIYGIRTANKPIQ